MADSEPLLFRATLGVLRPVTEAATEAVKASSGQTVRVEIKRTSGNVKRMSLYWVLLRIASEQLSDAVDGVMSTRLLHRRLKREYGLAKEVTSKRTGEIIDWDYDSISFASMAEHERAAFIDWTVARLSGWIGCDITDLRREAEAA
ncbi:hypothetical protein [Sphingomonas baiyangensis]|uniref:Uncharacterized protein n=1 Tax=Sphingomonas baiyangensis TaxID=2572576 RepID=A0A4U1L2E7_9SPHN|nr:hypothetical protein [Sphingomonas baiyangensis]TKD50185.1 hypothetical protein FBR43_05025 [Sphingomonas baiyangensis]